MDKFRVARTGDEACENWLICFGTDKDDRNYYITTNNVPGSELYTVSGGAKVDAELVCKLLNEYYARKSHDRMCMSQVYLTRSQSQEIEQ